MADQSPHSDCTCATAFVRLMGHHGTACPRYAVEAPGTPYYYESLKRDAVAGKLFQGATIAWLVQRIEHLDAALDAAQAQLDRAQLLLVKSRDCLDLAIAETQQKPADEEGGTGG